MWPHHQPPASPDPGAPLCSVTGLWMMLSGLAISLGSDEAAPIRRALE